MEVRFYRNTSHYKKVDKRAGLALIATADCNLLDSTSVINPTLIVDKSLLGNLANVNYMYIPDFGRYYFVTNMEAIPGGMAGISGEVDVLTSNANKILGLRCQISRQEFDFNMDLPDPDIPVMVERQLSFLNFNKTPFSTNPPGRHFVLTVSGSNKNGGV